MKIFLHQNRFAQGEHRLVFNNNVPSPAPDSANAAPEVPVAPQQVPALSNNQEQAAHQTEVRSADAEAQVQALKDTAIKGVNFLGEVRENVAKNLLANVDSALKMINNTASQIGSSKILFPKEAVDTALSAAPETEAAVPTEAGEAVDGNDDIFRDEPSADALAAEKMPASFYKTRSAASEVRKLFARAKENPQNVSRENVAQGLNMVNEAYNSYLTETGVDADGHALNFVAELKGYLDAINAGYIIVYDAGSNEFKIEDKPTLETLIPRSGDNPSETPAATPASTTETPVETPAATPAPSEGAEPPDDVSTASVNSPQNEVPPASVTPVENTVPAPTVGVQTEGAATGEAHVEAIPVADNAVQKGSAEAPVDAQQSEEVTHENSFENAENAQETLSRKELSALGKGFRESLSSQELKTLGAIREKSLGLMTDKDFDLLGKIVGRMIVNGTYKDYSSLDPRSPEEAELVDKIKAFNDALNPEEKAIVEKNDQYLRSYMENRGKESTDVRSDMPPEERQAKIQEIQGQLKNIEARLSDLSITPEETQRLTVQKEQLTAELNALIETSECPKKVPETVVEKLEQQMEQALDKLKNAKTSAESFAAIMQIIGTLVQYMKGAFDGTLNDSLKKAEEENKKNDKTPEGNKEETEKDLEGRVKEELAERAKAKPGESADEARTTPETLEENANGLKEEKEAEVKEIETDIEGLDKDIKDLKGKNEVLIGQKGEIEKKMNELQGQENMDTEIESLKAQLEAIQTSIDANTKAIETLDKRRDDLVAKKEALSKEVVVIDKIKTDTESAKTKMTEVMKIVADVWNEKFPGKKMPKISITFDADGDIHLTIEGLDEETKTALPEGTDVTDGRAEVDPKAVTEQSEEQNKIEPAKDAPVGQIRKDKNNNYWVKGEDRMWSSYNEGDKKSDSGFDKTRWGDSLMDENTAEVVDDTVEVDPASVEADSEVEQEPKDLLLTKAQDYITDAIGRQPGIRSAIDVQSDGNGKYILSVDAGIIQVRAGDQGVQKVKELLMHPGTTQNIMTNRITMIASADELEERFNASKKANNA